MATEKAKKKKKGTAKDGGRSDVPATLKRSSPKAQRTYAETRDSAEESYGKGERASRAAFASLKHSFEKVGDHWEAKVEKGPSDEQAAKKGASARTGGTTAEGVDANAPKAHLMDLAKRLDVSGRSTMTKPELVEAIKKVNRRQSAKALRESR